MNIPEAENQLKACPFCGRNLHINSAWDNNSETVKYFVEHHCDNGKIYFQTVRHVYSLEELIEAVNRRA